MPPEAEAPAAPPPEAPMDDMAGLSDILNNKFNEPAPEPIQKPSAPKAEEPAAKPPAKASNEPKKPWEIDAASPDADTEQAEPEMKPEAKTRWGELRKTENAYKELKPKYEQLTKELEELRNAPKEAPEEVVKELEDLRKFRAAYDVVNTPEYKEAVEKPYKAAATELKHVADYAGLKFQDLLDIAGEPSKLQRRSILRNLVSTSEKEISVEDAVATAEAAIESLIPVYAKDAELRAKADEIRNAMEGENTKRTEAQKQAHMEALNKASREMATLLTPKFKSTGIFDDPAISKKISEARPSDPSQDPMMAAYQAQSAVLLPVFLEKYNAMVAEVSQLKKSLNARSRSAPGVSTSSAPERTQTKSEDEALAELGELARGSFQR